MADTDPNTVKLKEMEAISKSLKSLSASLDASLNTTTKNVSKKFKEVADGANYFGDKLSYVEDSIIGISKNIRTLNIKKKFNAKQVIGLNEQLKNISGEIETIQKAHGPFEKADIEYYLKKIDELAKRTNKLKGTTSGVGKSFTEQTKSLSGGVGQFKDLFSSLKGGSVRGLMQTATSAGEAAEKMKMLGGATKLMGGALGGVSKLLGGPAGIAMVAGKALFDMTIQADTFVKNANKAFASIRGPDIMTRDIEGQFKEFNDQVYSAAEVIKTGLSTEAMKGFLEAVSQTGYNVTQFQGGLTSYTDAIDTAAKASRILGVDVVQAGQYMGDLGKEYRENLDEMGKSFNQLAFDAKKSGLNTTNFWNIVQNATSSLTLYGVKLDQAGKILSTFSHNQVGGAKDAAAAAEGMLGVFKEVDRGQNAIAMSMMEKGVPGIIAKTFGGKASEAGTKATGIRGQIEKVKGMPKTQENLEALDKLHTDLVNAEKDEKNYRKDEMLAQKGQFIELGTDFGALASNASTLVPAMLKGILPEFTNLGKIDDTNQALLELSKMTGMQVQELRTLVKNGQFTNQALEDLSKDIGIFGDNFDQGSGQKAIQDMDANNEKGLDELTDTFQKAGMDPIDAKHLAGMAQSNVAIRAALKNIFTSDKKDAKEVIKELQSIVTSNDVSNQVTTEGFNAEDRNGSVLEKKATDTFKKIKTLTLSSQEIMDAAQNEVQYRAYSMGAFKAMNKGITAIAKILTSWFSLGTKEYKSDEELAAEEDRKETPNPTESVSKISPERMLKAAKAVSANREIQMSPAKMAAVMGAITKQESDNDNFAAPYVKDKVTGERRRASSATGAAQFLGNRKSKKTGEVIPSKAQNLVDKYGKELGIKGTKIPTFTNRGHGKKDDMVQVSDPKDPNKVDLTDPETTSKLLAAEIADLPSEYQKDPEKIIASHFMGQAAVAEAIKNTAYGGNWKDFLPPAPGSKETGGINPSGKEYIASVMAKGGGNFSTMDMPRKVTSPGIAELHSGESIFPSVNNSKLRTTPLLNDNAMTGAMGGSGDKGQTFNINVYAMEKDLSQRIANEVRGVLYKTQM